jgi:hypothetical protein
MKIYKINKWQDYRDLVSSPEFDSWVFRGQSDKNWPLYSSLSRYLLKFGVHEDAWSHQEERIIRIFKHKAHLFLQHVPKNDDPIHDDTFEWLAIMQHHGAPTRLLDFTFSPYVAAFFALQQASTDAAIGALFPPKIDSSNPITLKSGQLIEPRKMWLRDRGNFEKYYCNGDLPFVMQGEPIIMNKRLVAQSGTFIVPGRLDMPIDKILEDYPENDKTIVKIELDVNSLRYEVMRDLYQSNITDSTLFPGIDGLARSLNFELEIHWAYNPKSMELITGFENPPHNLPKALKYKINKTSR